MGAPERLSIRARLRIAIVALVTAIVVALSAVHLHGVIDETFDDVGERARIISEHVNTYLVEMLNRPPPPEPEADLETREEHWYEAVRQSASLRRLLQKSLIQSSSVVDVAIVDANNVILSAADRSRIGKVDEGDDRSWAQWQQHDLFWRLWNLYRSRRDLAIETPIGTVGSNQPVFKVRVSLSPVLLRRTIEPTLKDLAFVSLVSLVLSMLLAVIVSKLVGGSLERLGQKIDLIAQGDLKSVQADRFESPEFITLESKLWWLGRQYSGARADIASLRTNMDRMLRRLDEAILLFGPDGRLQMAGEAVQRLLARPRDDVVGKAISDLFPPWTSLGAAIDGAVAERKIVREQVVNLERPNMPSVRMILSIEPIESVDSTGPGFLIRLRDAETRQQIEAGLDTAQRLAAISRLTSGVAHEIKNPLNAMMLHLEIAQEKHRSGHDASNELGIVRSELLRLDKVVKALLDFNRPLDVKLAQCDVRAMSDEIGILIRPQAQAAGVQLNIVHECDHAHVKADPDLLKQAILNVAVNAIEASGARGHVRLGVERVDTECVLAIEDDGPGIPPEIRDKIFNLYFTTKHSGTGVGLAMTYRIMQLHGGTVSVESEIGKGTCFRLALPAKQREAAA